MTSGQWAQYRVAEAPVVAVTLHSRNVRLIKLVRELASPLYVKVVPDLPRKADVVVTCGALARGVELYAASLMASVVVLPEGGEWLAGRLSTRWSVLVGSDMAKAGPLIKRGAVRR